MALTLTNAITATQTTFDVTGSDALSPGDLKTIGSETLEIRTANRGTPNYGEAAYWRVNANRGSLGTTKAAHAAGASVTTATFGGGGGSISVTDGTTTVADVTSIQTPRTVVEESAGVASLGGTVISSPDDPGAIGPGNLWLQSNAGEGGDDYYQLNVRNDADDGWFGAGPIINTDRETYVTIASPDDSAELQIQNSGEGPASISGVDGFGARKFQIDSGPSLLTGADDPTVGAGVAALPSSLYLQHAIGPVVQLWQKTGAADTAWTTVFGNTSFADYNAAGAVNIQSAVGQQFSLQTDNEPLNLTTGTAVLAISGAGITLNTLPFGPAANVPDCATDDPTDLQTTLNALLAAIKASGEMEPD